MAIPRKTSLVLLAAAAILAAWLAWPRPAPQREAAQAEVSVRSEVSTRVRPVDADARRVARARWEDRRARIRAAHAPARDDAPRSPAPSSRSCAEGDCSSDAAEDGGDKVFDAFVDETTTLTQGCEELLGGKPTLVRISARLIGAPDIGTIVESVEVSGPGEGKDALAECLTEGMYTLELGDAATNFERDAVLIHGLLDEVAAEEWVAPERVAEIREQMLDGGLDPGSDPMVVVGADDPSATP